jgi:hypothetical protein
MPRILPGGAPDPQVLTAHDLGALRHLQFFLSPRRARLLAPGLSPTAAEAAQDRLAALQSVCGCSAAALGLLAGGAGAWWQGGSGWVVGAWALGAAVIGKIVALLAAYAAFLLQLSVLQRSLRAIDAATGSSHDHG